MGVIGTNLKRLRTAAGLTQYELAKRADVTVTAVSSWERGANEPRSSELPKLAKALRCKTDDFFRKVAA